MLRDGGSVLIGFLATDLPQDDAKQAEIALIAEFRSPMLTNLTDGGDGATGWVPSDVVKEKIAASRRGKPLSDETRAKLSAANMGRTSPNKGIVFPDEWRANISAGLRRRYEDPTERRKASESGRLRYSNDNERALTAVATRMSGPSKNNASGFKGVSFCNRTKKWVAQIKDATRRMIGRFPTPEAAASAYDQAAYAAWGKDCYLNFPAEMAA